jgi:thiosulfate/3-mercaptopyruvate sulfurtransferase
VDLITADNTFLDADALHAKFSGAGIPMDKRVVTYCGGGIAATADSFALKLLGHDDVGIYDNSLSEWAKDPKLPMEAGK